MNQSESQQLTLVNKNGDLGNVQSQDGLTENEANKRLQKYGPNSIPEQKTRPWVIFLRKMWAPVPWMLEASILLELVLGKLTNDHVLLATNRPDDQSLVGKVIPELPAQSNLNQIWWAVT